MTADTCEPTFPGSDCNASSPNPNEPLQACMTLEKA